MIYELLSKRRKKEITSGEADIYQYDSVSPRLRVQIQQILSDAIGPVYEIDSYTFSTPRHNPNTWSYINKILCREMGVHRLSKERTPLPNESVLSFLGMAASADFLDVLEVCCRAIDLVIGAWPDHQRDQAGIEQDPKSALKEINYRLRESSLGYQYDTGQLFRLDSDYTHEEIVKPALRLLSRPAFSGAQSEFLQAHRHYRAGEYPQAITEAAKAFESALKSVCDLRGWTYEKGSRVSDLLKRVRAEGLWPDYLDSSFDQLIATLSSGLPKIRNEDGAHGQGRSIRQVPPYVAEYALNLAAAKIRLIVEAAGVESR